MIIKLWLVWVVMIVLNLLLILIGNVLFKKMKKNPGAGGGIGFIVGLGLMLTVVYGSSRLYVINGDSSHATYAVITDGSYSSESGSSYDVDNVWGECVVINETSRKIAIEEVIYGAFFADGAFYIVEPDEMERIPCTKMNYFWDDSPPDEVSVSEGVDEVSKWWLRYYRE